MKVKQVLSKTKYFEYIHKLQVNRINVTHSFYLSLVPLDNSWDWNVFSELEIRMTAKFDFRVKN